MLEKILIFYEKYGISYIDNFFVAFEQILFGGTSSEQLQGGITITTFGKIWNTEVKQLAEACITEPEIVRLMVQSENHELSKEEKNILQEIRKSTRILLECTVFPI